MVGVGLYIRLGILETPTFSRLLAENRIERAPVFEVIKRQPKSIVLVALAKMGEMAPAYVYSVFVLTYGTTVLGSSRDLLLSALVASAAVSFFTVPIAGYLSDRIGRKRMYLIGSVATGLFAFIYFALLNTGMPSWIFIAIVLSFVPQHLMYGPQAALIAECFTPRLRYSGASIGYQLSSVIAGGPAPLIATALLAAFGSGYVIAVYILFCAIVSVVATVFLPDYTNRDISEEYA
jgi:MFS family permease